MIRSLQSAENGAAASGVPAPAGVAILGMEPGGGQVVIGRRGD